MDDAKAENKMVQSILNKDSVSYYSRKLIL
jgi:hypothetical protein